MNAVAMQQDKPDLPELAIRRMRVLIVGRADTARWTWRRGLQDQGHAVHIVGGEDEAVAMLRDRDFDVIVLDVMLDRGSALAVADYASFRHPGTRIIFVTSGEFLADGTLFQLSANVCATIPRHFRAADVVAMVTHYGAAA